MNISIGGFVRLLLAIFLLFGFLSTPISSAKSSTSEKSKEDIFMERRNVFDKISAMTGIPWHYLAAIDQYERALSIANSKTRPAREGIIGIYYSPSEWSGLLNPDQDDKNPLSILFFKGIGKDGSGDGLADLNNDLDVLYTLSTRILKYGTSPNDFRIGLWEYYQNSRSVQRIEQFSKIYATFDKLDLFEHSFLVPLRSDYSYRSTWGASRSYGGYRIHEGTDIFASYGVPVRSTCYGAIEIRGWNRFGGWRVGIRDLNNVYHYYAHMSGFNKEINQGDVVKPGEVIGWVGSSGYGKPGTQGKFAPHLHYGLYRDYGLAEWSFDPYPYLRKWEREERKRRKQK
jgi:murein DD-endopeptidase MepM/ murein hydrolase activator NlpD